MTALACRRPHVETLALVLSVSLFGFCSAETLPTKGAVDSRLRTALYSAEEIYRLGGCVGYDIELIFEPGERFTGKAGGDLEAGAIEAVEEQGHIKPRAAVVGPDGVTCT